jgi:hypothetical protein
MMLRAVGRVIRVAWRWLISRPDRPMRTSEVIVWWELRRIPYNVFVGTAGAISLLLFFLFITWSGELKPGEDAVEPMALMVAPLAVNFFYTAGWIGELMLMLIRRHGPHIGPILFVVGTVFSVAVVFLPAALWGAECLLRLIGLSLPPLPVPSWW